MARCGRLDAPGAIHHVMIRGVDRRAIFLDDRDRASFVADLEVVLTPTTTRLFAWALVGNHLHLLVRTGTLPLSIAMQQIGTRYVTRFNRRHERVGHLFQGRFKSLLIEEDDYWITVIRYIHRNPLAAGLVPDLAALARYEWAGHAALMGRMVHAFQATGPVLERFGSTPEGARRELARWMSAGNGEAGLDSEVAIAAAPADFARPPRHDRWLHRDAHAHAPQSRLAAIAAERCAHSASRLELARRWPPERLVAHVCAALHACPERLRDGRRCTEEAEARAAIGYLGHVVLGRTIRELVPLVGVSASAIGRQLERGREITRVRAIHLA